MKHLSLIQALILLHERERPKSRQRSKKLNVQLFEITSEKIKLANKLANEILISDLPNLSPECGLLLLLLELITEKTSVLHQLKPSDFHLVFRDIQRYTRWDKSRLKSHLEQLRKKKYIEIHGTGIARTYKISYVRKKRTAQHFLMTPDGLINSRHEN